MKILLTGANGFFGSKLLKMLIPEHEVTITLRETSNTARINDVIFTEDENVKILYIDKISDNEIDEYFRNYGVDLIVHCATDYGKREHLFYNVFQSNVLFPMKLLELGLKNGLKYFINTDSYFNKMHLTYNALPHYSKTKKLFLDYLKEIGSEIIIVNMRLEHIYGPNDNDDKFIPFLLNKLKNNEFLSLTHGHQKRDFTHIVDVVNSYLNVISSLEYMEKPCYKELEIGSGVSIELRTFIELAKSLMNSQSELQYGAIDYRDDEIMNSFANDSLKRFSVQYSVDFKFMDIETGIKDVIQQSKTISGEK